MQNQEADATSSLSTAGKPSSSPATVEDQSCSDQAEPAITTPDVEILETDQSRLDKPMNLAVSSGESSNQTINKSKCQLENVVTTSYQNRSNKKYFLRNAMDKLKETEARITVDEADEDKENLISQLSIFKQLPDGNYSCDLCCLKNVKTIVDQKTLIIRHLLRAHTYSYNFECASCPDTFKKEAWLANHSEMTHMSLKNLDKFFECDKCKHRSKNEDLLKLHILRKHASAYKYVCKCCAKCFKTWVAKNEHEKSMDQGRKKSRKSNYMCSKCSEILATRQDLINHLRTVHPDDFCRNGLVILHNCKHCSKFFMSHKSLRQHLTNHESSSLRISAEHKKPTNSSAPTSQKTTNASAPTTTVEIEGTGFSCNQCGKRLSSKDHLKKHERVHSGERPYACPECGQAFALRTTMRIHALSHSGIKPYVCRMCHLGYSQRSALMIHWKSKHKDLPPPPPIEIHQYFDREGRVLIPY